MLTGKILRVTAATSQAPDHTMVFNFFKSKSKEPEPGPGSAGREGGSSPPARDPRKAASFFRHAQSVGDHDYAITCFISGLQHDPANLPMHEALRDVALKRKATGGKPASFSDKIKGGGRDPVERLMHAESIWSKDPHNLQIMASVMERAVEVHEAEPELGMEKVAQWVGEMYLVEVTRSERKPRASEVAGVAELFAKLRIWDRAVMACQIAAQLAPEDYKLQQRFRDMTTEKMMHEGGYAAGNASEVDFRRSIRDKDKQDDLAAGDSLDAASAQKQKLLAKLRADYEDDPSDLVRLGKVAEALAESPNDDAENEAIRLYLDAHERSGQYKFKVRAGDLRLRQMNRHVKEAKVAADAKPGDAALKQELERLTRETLQLELAEYAERSKNYPTDNNARFQMARRLVAFRRWDEAISAFQITKGDARFKVASNEQLARCFMAKEWYDEAIDTLREAIDAHPDPTDAMGKTLRYLLMDGLGKSAQRNADSDTARASEQVREALRIASQLLQVDINYRDVRQRVETLREFQETLAKR